MKMLFRQFNRWVAIEVDGEIMGYMAAFPFTDYALAKCVLHLKKNTPAWMRAVRDKNESFATLTHCKAALRAAMYEFERQGKIPLGENVVQFPVRQ